MLILCYVFLCAHIHTYVYHVHVYISWNRAFSDDRLIYPVQFRSRIFSFFYLFQFLQSRCLSASSNHPSICLPHVSFFYFRCSLYVTQFLGEKKCGDVCIVNIFVQVCTVSSTTVTNNCIFNVYRKVKMRSTALCNINLVGLHPSGFTGHFISSVDMVPPCSEIQIRERMQICKYIYIYIHIHMHICTYIYIYMRRTVIAFRFNISQQSTLAAKTQQQGKNSSWESSRKFQTSLHSSFISVRNMKQISQSNGI